MSLVQFKSFLIQAGLASEFCLLSGVCIIILLVSLAPRASFGLSFWVSVFSLGLAFFFADYTPIKGQYYSFNFHFYSSYLKQFFCISASVALFSFMEWRQSRNLSSRPEIYILLLLSCLGLEVMIQANSYLLLFLAAELFSICSFALAKPQSTTEPGYKSIIQYFGVGALASGIGLFGLSWLLGFDGAVSDEPALAIFQSVGGILFVGFLLFKLGGFPYHFWVPGVYTNAPSPWVGYISVAPKVAAAFSVLYFTKSQEINFGVPLLIIATIGITIGNLSALRSLRVRELFGASAIAQGGMLLVPAIIAFQIPDSEFQLLVYSIGYGVVHQGAFCAIQYFENTLSDDFSVSDLAGKFFAHPLASISLTILVLSIIGLPPTVGFLGKVLVFSTLIPAAGIWNSGLVLLLFSILVFNTLLSLAYYYQIPYFLIFKENKTELVWIRSSVASLLWTLLAGFFAILAFAKPSIFFPHL